MNQEAIESLLVALGTKSAGVSGVWHRAPCPLSPWLHKNGKDSNPSFAFHVEEGEPLRFHCFTCESGNIQKLLQIVEMNILKYPGTFNGDLAKAREIIESLELELPVLPSYSEFSSEKKKVFEELPAYFLETFVPALKHDRAKAYLLERRGFTEEEVTKFDLRYDHERDMVVFPYWDVFGRFAGLRGRRIIFPWETSYGVGHHDYVVNGVNNSGLVFYNETALNLPGPVVLVEGQVDCIKVARVWPKTVANLTAKPILEKVSKLAQTDGVVLMLDGDATGRAGTQKFLDLLVALRINVLPLYLPYDEATGQKSDPDSIGAEGIVQLLSSCGLIDKP